MRPRTPKQRWWAWLGAWTALGLIIRVLAVLGRPHRPAGGDAYYYHYAANLLVAGQGWINPFTYYRSHRVVAAADFPPGFVMVLAAASLVGFKSYFAHRIWCAVLGAGAVAVCGCTGREIAGPRAGLITAFVVAVYPNIWMSDEMAMSETLSPLLVAVVLQLAYRFWKRPSVTRAAGMGLAIGVAALARDELSVLGLLLFVPIVLLAGRTWRARTAMLAAGAAAALFVIGPWVGYNLSRFQNPVLISTGLGPTLASTNCAAVYSGPLEGYWSRGCITEIPLDLRADESVQAAQEQTYAERYIEAHESRLPVVVAARIGRAFGLYHPIGQINLDSLLETRPRHWALLGLWMYYGLAALSVAGAVVLRRRTVPLFPLLAVGATVVVSVVLSFGDTRYRTPFEVSLVILASAAIAAASERSSVARGTGQAALISVTSHSVSDLRASDRGFMQSGTGRVRPGRMTASQRSEPASSDTT